MTGLTAERGRCSGFPQGRRPPAARGRVPDQRPGRRPPHRGLKGDATTCRWQYNARRGPQACKSNEGGGVERVDVRKHAADAQVHQCQDGSGCGWREASGRP
jgi:hypothetical protein